MPYYDALKTKWATLSPGTTAQKLAAINALTVAGPAQSVPISTVVNWLRMNNLWLPIKAAVAFGSSPGAMAAVDLNSDLREQTIDFTLPLVGAMLADLVSHGLLSQAQSDALVAMGATTLPWWQSAGYTSPIGQGDLAAAGGLS